MDARGCKFATRQTSTIACGFFRPKPSNGTRRLNANDQSQPGHSQNSTTGASQVFPISAPTYKRRDALSEEKTRK
jgi:hypothetical protein